MTEMAGNALGPPIILSVRLPLYNHELVKLLLLPIFDMFQVGFRWLCFYPADVHDVPGITENHRIESEKLVLTQPRSIIFKSDSREREGYLGKAKTLTLVLKQHRNAQYNDVIHMGDLYVHF